MKNIRLTFVEHTELNVTERHFGGNIIATEYTSNGRIDDHFRIAIDELDISDLRYPAGQPDVVYEAGLLVNGSLPDHLLNFFRSLEDRAGQVVLVTPAGSSYTGPAELKRFVELVMEDFGPKIRAIEVGNEYWQYQGESAYGTIANESVLAISEAINSSGYDTDIWVQMANATGKGSDFHQHPTLGWHDRTIEANKAILNQLSERALDAIDGLVEHSYNRDTGQILGDEIDSTNMLWLDVETWREHSRRDYDLALTEWNIRTSNEDQLGIKSASTLIHHFENLMKLGADDMHVWSPQHNTSTDLAGSRHVFLDDETGVVVNTVIGATFDLMSSAIVGKHMLNLRDSGSGDLISTHGYANDTEVTVYVASRSEQSEAVSFSTGGFFDGAILRSATKIGYDSSPESSDGVHWFQPAGQFVQSASVIIDGKSYYLNEHDVNASIEVLHISQSEAVADFSFTLLPYEVVQLTYDLPNDQQFYGTALNDRMIYTSGEQMIRALSGNDTVDSGQNSDTVYGGPGNDHIILGAGDDIGYGEDDDDFISGWGGHDTISGGRGNDTVNGFQGDDEIDGNAGNDHLNGNDGDDTIFGSGGFDRIEGGDGADRLHGGNEADQLFGGAGNDSISGGSGFDRLEGGDDNDVLDGGESTDVLFGGNGNDLIFGGDENDRAFGGTGFDTMNGDDGNDTLFGEGQADILSGGSGDDQLFGGNGVDQLLGGAGNDWLDGGIHNDRLRGGDGHDTLSGGAGFDFLEGEGGNDKLYGGNEADRMTGGAGNDTILGENGADYLFGGNGDDLLDGGASTDVVIGGHGTDILIGGHGNDRMIGGTGNDNLDGGTDNDDIYGGAGFDTISGGFGNDRLSGNFNADIFVFHDFHGHDVINDFEFDNFAERIDFRSLSNLDDFSDVLLNINQVGGDVVISTGTNSSVRLKSISIDNLEENDFTF